MLFMCKPFIDQSAFTDSLVIHSGAQVWKQAFVKNCILGECSKINDFGRVENTQLGIHTELQRFSMVYNSRIGDYTYTGRNFVCWHAEIGKFCSISWNVSIGGANHDYNRIAQHAFLYAPQFGMLEKDQNIGYDRFTDNCVVGNDVWIACNAIICRGVKIGDGAVIAAGAVVTKDCEPYTIYAGVPARSIKLRCDKGLAVRLCKAKWWDLPPAVIKDNLSIFNCEISPESVEMIERLVHSYDKR